MPQRSAVGTQIGKASYGRHLLIGLARQVTGGAVCGDLCHPGKRRQLQLQENGKMIHRSALKSRYRSSGFRKSGIRYSERNRRCFACCHSERSAAESAENFSAAMQVFYLFRFNDHNELIVGLSEETIITMIEADPMVTQVIACF